MSNLNNICDGIVNMARQCRSCGSPSLELFNIDYRISRCNKCGFLFVTDEDLQNYRSPQYGLQWTRMGKHPTYYWDGRGFCIRHPTRIYKLLNLLEHYRKSNRLLDVGCSMGSFLIKAREAGWQTEGVETDTETANFAMKHYNLKISTKPLQECGFEDNMFDIVFCSHVLEHICELREVLSDIHRILRPRGLFIVAVPTEVASPTYYLKRKEFTIGPPNHVNYFTFSSLSNILQTSSFKVIKQTSNIELLKILSLLKGEKIYLRIGDEYEKLSSLADPSQNEKSHIYHIISFLKERISKFCFFVFGMSDEITIYAEKVVGNKTT